MSDWPGDLAKYKAEKKEFQVKIEVKWRGGEEVETAMSKGQSFTSEFDYGIDQRQMEGLDGWVR